MTNPVNEVKLTGHIGNTNSYTKYIRLSTKLYFRLSMAVAVVSKIGIDDGNQKGWGSLQLAKESFI